MDPNANSDDLVAAVVEKAGNDATFRAALIADPKGALAESFGVKVPDNLNVRVVEEGASEVVVVLPATGSGISLDELAGVAGAGETTWGPNCQSCS
ncbi:MAG: NHLP leader peptide family RiPP precursor [Candidatus Nanopelagicales bacterium]|jgi:hypothetical protein|nr:NHLP leader peptide family RiPP precursor [Candidatus Nanopelagicales bacterium]MDP4887529.1 NHLP leader peptide family RiPP precursor [Candidatus Nanopelagicales bacterium]